MDQWSIEEVGLFLSREKVPEDIIKRFKEEEIDGEALVSLTPEYLKILGMKIGPSIKLLKRISQRSKVQSEEPVTELVGESSQKLPTTNLAKLPSVDQGDSQTLLPQSTKAKKKTDHTFVPEKINGFQEILKFSSVDRDSNRPENKCFVCNIRPKGTESKFESTCAFVFLSKESIKDTRSLWGELKRHQGELYSCLTKKAKTKFTFNEYLDEIQDKHEQSCGILSTVPYPVKFKEMEVAGRVCVVIVENSLLLNKEPGCNFMVENSPVLCSVTFDKRRVHATYESKPLQLTFQRSMQTDQLPVVNEPDDDSPQTPANQADGVSVLMSGCRLVETPLAFDKAVEKKTYTKGNQMGCLETGPTDLIEPVHEFKLFRLESEDKEMGLGYFTDQSLRFACGCLNSRTNGIIHFGVADGDEDKAQKHDHFSREIVGVDTDDKLKESFKNALTESIKQQFVEYADIADRCIRCPKFIPVGTAPQSRCVVEVHVKPQIMYTRGIFFRLLLSKGGRKSFRRIGPNTCTVAPDSQYMPGLYRLDADREKAEGRCEMNRQSKHSDKTGLADKAKTLLCHGNETLDQNITRIIVLSKPDQSDVAKCTDFLLAIKWQVVIDFDDLCLIRKTSYPEPCTQNRLLCAEDISKGDILGKIFPKPAWILGNGSQDDHKPPYQYNTWFQSDRNKNVSKLIDVISSNFPPGRTTVLFLLLSKNYLSELCLFKEFVKQYTGLSQLVYVAESHDIADPWEKELTETVGSALPSAGIVGMDWMEFNELMKQLSGQSTNTDFLLPCSIGVGIPLDRQCFDLEVIYPLGQKECEYIKKMESGLRKRLSKEEEEHFYSGQNVSWENFWFTENKFNHVLDRDVLDDATRKAKKLLQTHPKEGRVFTLEVKHEVGAGATTLCKHILWQLASSYLCRCCVVTQISNETVNSLLQLWRPQFLNDCSTLPVLALLDNCDPDVTVKLEDEVKTKVQQKCHPTEVPVVVFIKNRMYATLPSRDEYSHDRTVLLRQKLSLREKNWFEDKFGELEKQSTDQTNFKKYAREHLISFMIMKNNFSQDYINSVVQNSYSRATAEERRLLRYLALISVYGFGAVFEAVFDTFMMPGLHRKKLGTWFDDLNESTKVLLKQVDMSADFGTGAGICVAHRLVAQALICSLTSDNSSGLAQLVLEFLTNLVKEVNSEFYTSRQLFEMTKQMMIHRRKDGPETELFSTLILEIKRHSLQDAAAVLETTYSCVDHPGFLQQLARLWYTSKGVENEWEDVVKSRDYAQRAVDLDPSNPYYHDTLGRVHKKIFFLHKDKLTDSCAYEDVLPCIESALTAIESFKNAQSKSLEWDQNNAGFCGEIETMSNLLALLRKILTERDRQRFCNSLNLDEPVCPIEQWERFWESLRKFKKRFHVCIRFLNDKKSIFKPEPDENVSRVYWKSMGVYRRFFANIQNEEILQGMTEVNRNWYIINKYLLGDSFRNVFNIKDPQKNGNERVILKEILEILDRNYELNPSDRDTLYAMTTVSMALHSPFGLSDVSKENLEKEYRRVFDLLLKWERAERKREYPSLHPFLFKTMFLWPRQDHALGTGEELKAALAELQRRFKERSQHMRSDPNGLHPKYENNKRTRPATTLFYLGTGIGLEAFVHINELQKEKKNSGDWESPYIKRRLVRMEGRREDESNIGVLNPANGNSLLKVTYIDKNRPFQREDVTFFLGFSWNGPIAFNVKQKGEIPQSEFTFHRQTHRPETSAGNNLSVETIEEDSKTLTKTKRLLQSIEKWEKGGKLNENQKTKIARKGELLRTVAELEERLNPTDDPLL